MASPSCMVFSLVLILILNWRNHDSAFFDKVLHYQPSNGLPSPTIFVCVCSRQENVTQTVPSLLISPRLELVSIHHRTRFSGGGSWIFQEWVVGGGGVGRAEVLLQNTFLSKQNQY